MNKVYQGIICILLTITGASFGYGVSEARSVMSLSGDVREHSAEIRQLKNVDTETQAMLREVIANDREKQKVMTDLLAVLRIQNELLQQRIK